MARAVQLDRMFSEVTFHKTGREIAAKAQLKLERVQAKIAERETRIAQFGPAASAQRR